MSEQPAVVVKEIRYANAADQLEVAAVENLSMMSRATADFPYLWKRYKNWVTAPPIVAVGESGGLIGFHATTFGRRNRYANNYYQLVHPAARGLGVGGKMLEFMLGRADVAGIERLKFKVPRADYGIAAMLFWGGFGLKHFGTDPKHYLFDFSIWRVHTGEDLMNMSAPNSGNSTYIPDSQMAHYRRAGVVLLPDIAPLAV